MVCKVCNEEVPANELNAYNGRHESCYLQVVESSPVRQTPLCELARLGVIVGLKNKGRKAKDKAEPQ